MSYSEENGQVVLTMSRRDYERLLIFLGMAASVASKMGEDAGGIVGLLNRLNSGNPHYTPYQVEEKKS